MDLEQRVEKIEERNRAVEGDRVSTLSMPFFKRLWLARHNHNQNKNYDIS